MARERAQAKADMCIMQKELREQFEAVGTRAGELCDCPAISIENCEVTLRALFVSVAAGYTTVRALVVNHDAR